MQKIALIAITAICLTSCDNTLDITADWKDIPIVYGIISPVDTAHYIRIEKAFLDPNTSALAIAQIADSLYYNELDAALVHTPTSDRFQLIQVDGALEGYPRVDGIFATTPNILYKVHNDDIALRAGEQYRIEINRSDRLPLVVAETTVPGRASLVRPFPGALLRFQYTNPFRILWQEGQNTFFYEVTVTVHYDEIDINQPGSLTSQSVSWPIVKNLTTNEIEVLGIEFYELLAGNIPVDPSARRTVTAVDIRIQSGSKELFEFTRIQQANTGITSVGGDIPQFTNLSEGLGLFTSANENINAFILHPETRDSLLNGSITRDLNFQ